MRSREEKVVEEQELNTVSEVELELEEDVIPTEEPQNDGTRLGDVVPCEYVNVEQQAEGYLEVSGAVNDGFYDHDGFYDEIDSSVSSISSDQMVDIVSQVEDNSEDELEEEEIPNENNTADDEQLDDVA